jgi:DNA-binding NtrC family response regulator
VLQEGEFSRVGGNQTIRANVRIVCATNKNLEEEVARKSFREDLFYRLNVVRIHLPPLRSRQEDIRQLSEYFLQKIAHHKHRPPLKLSEEAARVLEAYPWPGNVRELENTIQRASVLATADVLLPKDIPLGQVSSSTSSDLHVNGSGGSLENAIETLFDAAASDGSIELLPWLEREFTLRAMRKTNSNQVRAAKLLGITRATLRKRLERNGALGTIDDE